MTKQERIDYWLKIAEHDLAAAESMFEKERYDWCLFIGHLIIEKVLKAFWVRDPEKEVPFIHNLLKLAKETRLNLSEEQRQFLDTIAALLQAYIFGSYAKGRQTEWSDIDLALVSDRFEGNFFYDRCKLSPYVIKINTDIETHPFRPEDFTKENPFVEEIIETGIQII